jgi:hypothetical protein
MAAIFGSVPITGFIAPTDDTDVFASHDDKYGRGGYRSVATLSDRDLITVDRRKEGMLVYVLSDGKIYTLTGGITNAHWTEFSVAGSNIEEGSTLTKIAGETISALRVVKLENDIAFIASCEATLDYNRVIGVSKIGAPAGQEIIIKAFGEVQDSSLNLQPSSLFLGTAGEILTSPPANGFVLKIGKVLSSDKIGINIQQVIVRN